MRGWMSTATTRPDGPTRRAAGKVTRPGPQPASSTHIPGCTPARTRSVSAPATASKYGFSSSGTSQAGHGQPAQRQTRPHATISASAVPAVAMKLRSTPRRWTHASGGPRACPADSPTSAALPPRARCIALVDAQSAPLGDDRSAAPPPVRSRSGARDPRARLCPRAPCADSPRAARRRSPRARAARPPRRRPHDGAPAHLPARALLRRARLEAGNQHGAQRGAAQAPRGAPRAPFRASRPQGEPHRLEPGRHLRPGARARAPGPGSARDHARDPVPRRVGQPRRAAGSDPSRRDAR